MPKVTVVCRDSATRDTCPTLYRTEDDVYYIQGYVVTAPEVLAEMNVPEGETVVRITTDLVRMIAQAAAASGLADTRAARTPVGAGSEMAWT
ncbi:MAG TPA: hypothetical protein VLW50_17450 [Streptosporangiaceae bacterium]|nr:hypothetical protein [Streptosporangiaceae bacterium]